MNKATMYAKQLTSKIEDGIILHKQPSKGNMNISFIHSNEFQDLCLYRETRYLGSLRCMLDNKSMRNFSHIYVG